LAKRQVGSVFKPIIYSKALIDGKEPCDFISNQKTVYTQYNDWTPKNSDGNYEGKYTLLGALTNSVNTISVHLCMKAGIKNIITYANTLGITEPLPEVPSLALGVSNISLKNMMSAYGTFAKQGAHVEPNSISTIYNKQNELIFELETKKEQLIQPKIAQDITNMLQSVVNHGTAKRLRYNYHFRGDIAGKTGTTQNHTDGWLIGYTPEWLGGVWVGADNPLIRFSSIKDGQGANMALPIWANFYKKLQEEGLQDSLHFPFENNLDCPLYKENTGFEKIFRKRNKRSNKTGFSHYNSQEDTHRDKKGRKKKKFKLFK